MVFLLALRLLSLIFVRIIASIQPSSISIAPWSPRQTSTYLGHPCADLGADDVGTRVEAFQVTLRHIPTSCCKSYVLQRISLENG